MSDWVNEFAKTYQAGAINTFILHGNVNDEFLLDGKPEGLKRYVRGIFPKRDCVIYYDLATGIGFPTAEPQMRESFMKMLPAVDTVMGTNYATGVPRDPARALPLIERYIRTRLVDNPTWSATVIIDYANLVLPSGLNTPNLNDCSSMITVHRWATDPVFGSSNVAFVLISENLLDLNPMITRLANVAKIRIPLPDLEERQSYIQKKSKDTSASWAIHTAGLSCVNIKQLIGKLKTGAVGTEAIYAEKQALIEKECYGLLEFVKNKYTLDNLGGHGAAKDWLLKDAKLLKDGNLDAVPMGYLICGPVGTGKTFMMSCYSGTLGIPCVKLQNFRSQWQGVTEGNWEKILNTLKTIGPVAVIIDEADAALGNRDQSGDSGTSSRVFSMLAQQMSDTAYRGKILWFLLTCRPDLLPIDLKRQGRAEVHIPLFYPSKEERYDYLMVLAKKNGVEVGFKTMSKSIAMDKLEAMKDVSGADIEGIVIRAKRNALLDGRKNIVEQDLINAIGDFSPTLDPEEVELQTLIALFECTNQNFIPPGTGLSRTPEARDRLAYLKAKLSKRG